MSDHDRIEMSMMTVAIGQAIGYGDIDEAKRIQRLMMDWIKASEAGRRAIYHAWRNEGPTAAGLDAT